METKRKKYINKLQIENQNVNKSQLQNIKKNQNKFQKTKNLETNSLKEKSKSKSNINVRFLKKKIKVFGRGLSLTSQFKRLKKSVKEDNIYCVDISVKPNNIFVIAKKYNTKLIKKSKILTKFSSGSYKTKLTKKKLKFGLQFLLTQLNKNLKKKISKVSSKTIIVGITCPLHLRSSIIESFAWLLKSNNLIYNIKGNKAFNGCRNRKKVRKKRYRSII
jgi:hypothetical protein